MRNNKKHDFNFTVINILTQDNNYHKTSKNDAY